METNVSGTCRSYKGKRYKCAEKGCETKVMHRQSFGAIYDQQSIKNQFKNSSPKKSTDNMEFNAKGIPKWSPNRYQKSSKNNAKTCDTKIMFLKMVKSLKFIVKTNVFDALAGCMCERGRYQKT